MKVSYIPLSHWNNGSGNWFESKPLLLLPAFIFAIFLGFTLELITVERLNPFLRIPVAITSYRHYNADKTTRRIQLLENQYVEHSLNGAKRKTLEPNAPFWEKSILFNVSHFHWLRNNDTICQVDIRHPKANILPILVHTARSHFSERLTIRKSWGSLLLYKKWSLRLVFLIGEADRGLDPSRNEVEYKEQEAMLDNEQSIFGDIVQGSFVDSYKNLTYKHMMGYKWILNFCSNAAFVMKVDDDMFIDIMRFLNWRNEDLKLISPQTTPAAQLPELYCSTFVGTKPQRCLGCKWYTSETEWPLDHYPDYCSGWCYGITVELIKKLYSALERVPFFWIDDVFATGVLLEEVKKIDYAFTPQYKHLWGKVKSLDFKKFRPMCEGHNVSMKGKFGAVVPIPRGSNFGRDMMCLWNKTVHDDSLSKE